MQPLPTIGTPKLLVSITAVLHEFEKLCIRHRCPGDTEWLNHDRMRPLFIIKDERNISRGADSKSSTRNLDVSRTRSTSYSLSGLRTSDSLARLGREPVLSLPKE